MTKLVCPRLIREENPRTPPVHHQGPSPSPSPSRCQETSTYNENPNKFNHFFLRSEFCSEQTRAGRTPSVCSFRPSASLGQVRMADHCLMYSGINGELAEKHHISLLTTLIIHFGYTRNNAIYMILYVIFCVWYRTLSPPDYHRSCNI